MKHYNIATAIIRKNNHIAMVKQHYAEPLNGDYWSLPSGKVEDGETFIDAAIRETKEETGLKLIDTPELIYICEYTNKQQNISCRIEMYEFTSFKGTIAPNDPDQSIIDAQFVDIKDAITHLTRLSSPPITEPALAYLKNNVKKNFHWFFEAKENGIYKHISTKDTHHQPFEYIK